MTDRSVEYSHGWVLAENILDATDPKRHHLPRFIKHVTDVLEQAGLCVSCRQHKHRYGLEVLVEDRHRKLACRGEVTYQAIMDGQSSYPVAEQFAQSMLHSFSSHA